MPFLLMWAFFISASFLSRERVSRDGLEPVEKIGSYISENTVICSPIHWGSEVSPDGTLQGDTYTGDYADYYNYFQIFVTNISTGTKRKVFSSDFRTLGWRWTSEGKIKISYNCGTSCLLSRVIDPDEYSYVNDSFDGSLSEENGWKFE